MTAIRFPKGTVGRRPITVALVNNMPDSAFADTEDQFRRRRSRPTGAVDLELYTIKEIPRSEKSRR